MNNGSVAGGNLATAHSSPERGGGTDTNVTNSAANEVTEVNLTSASSSAERGGGSDTNATNSVSNEITGDNQTLSNEGDSAASSDITTRAIGDAGGMGRY